MARKLLTIDDAAARLGLDRQDVLAMIRAGRLHGTVADGVMRVVEQDVQFLLGDAALTREHLRAAVTHREAVVVPPPGLTDEERATFFSTRCNVPKINLPDYDIPADVVALVPKEVAVRLKVIPVQRAGNSLIVAMADPTNLAALDDIKFLTMYNVEPVVATETGIGEAIERCYGRG